MIEQILEKQIEKEIEERKTRERSGKISPSSLGRCYRYQCWNRLNEVPSNPIPMNTLKTFRAGNIYHRDLQSLLPEEDVEFEFTIDDVHGFADWVGDGFVADFKTINQWGWKYLHKDSFDVGKDKLPNVLQVMVECMLLHKPIGYLIFINKDNYEIKEFELLLSDWEGAVQLELDTVRAHWNKVHAVLPKAEARCYGGKECNYCNFRDKCKEIERGGK